MRKKRKLTTHNIENGVLHFETTIIHTDNTEEPYKTFFVLPEGLSPYQITLFKKKCYVQFKQQILLIRKLYDNGQAT
ncbi:MAG: hypothetical protein ACWA5P_01825 [bacterium]